MRVAIIGAGIAGLSSAIALEKYGIAPILFERTGFIGDREQHASALLSITDKRIQTLFNYVKKEFGICITPLSPINILTHNSPYKQTILNGTFGSFLKRNKDEDSVKGELFSQLHKTEVVFNKKVDYRQISKEYDHVILADGKPDSAEELGCWTDWIRGYIKGAVVRGNFNPKELIMWLDKEYCKNGYAYLSPFDNQKASVILFVTDIGEKEVDNYWDRFQKKENFKYDIIETFKVKHGSGYVAPHQVDNIYLAGNCGGSIDPFLGFGQTNSIISGALAAKAIATGENYEKLLKKVVKNLTMLYSLRTAFNKATNKDLDRIVSLLHLPLVKSIAYDSPLDVVLLGSMAVKLSKKLKE